MHWLTDLRLALRVLGRHRLFAAAAVTSLAAGVAATCAVVSLADALLAPSAGVRDATRVVDIGRGNDGRGFDNMSHPAFEYLRAHATSFDGIAGVEFGGRPMTLSLGATSERVFGTLVSANFFEVLDTRLVLGRGFRADEDAVPGERPVVVLTHRFWTQRLAGDPAVLGRPLRLNNREFAVVGVAEPGFEGVTLAGTDLWTPVAMVAEARGRATAAELTDARGVMHMGVGRLRSGVTRAVAQAELNTLMAQFKAATPAANPRHTVALLPTSRVPGPMRTPFLVFLGVLFALAAALFAIACSNVSGLLLVRATARRREMATRLSLGASRRRLLAQLVTETAVLFLMAAVVAVPLTVAAVALLRNALPAVPVALNLPLAVNARVLVFALGLSLSAAIIFGLAPARHALGADLAPLLAGGTATSDRRRQFLRHGLVIAQVALSLMLVTTAGLFARALQAATATDPGFTTRDIVLANVNLALSGYRGEQAADLAERLRVRLSALPGVTAAAAARVIPLQGSGLGLGRLRLPGADASASIDADWNVVTPEFFAVASMRVVAGRGLREADRAGVPRVAVVNEAFVRAAWPGRTGVGERLLHTGADDREGSLEVVGVVANAKYRYISDAPEPFLFVPLAQFPTGDLTFFLRHAPGAAPGDSVRAAVADVEPSVAVMFVQAFDDAAAVGLTPQRVAAWVAGAVGTFGLTLAAFGLYGVMAFVVTTRTRDLAIRLALGATPAQLGGIVVRQAALLGGLGACAGLGLAAGIGTLLQSLLVNVPVVDLPSYAGAATLCLAVLTAASWLPARRAAATDPATALRAE